MAMLSTGFSRLVNGWRDTLFPPACVFCGASVEAAASSCAACAGKIRIWPRHHCRLCGGELPDHLAPGPCGRCLRRAPPQLASESLYAYRDGPVRSALLDWKLHARDAGVLWLLDAAESRLCDLFGEHSLLLPVPMPLPRMRRAGRHHAADLCRAIGERTGARVDWRLLRRNGVQPRQSALGGRQRWNNLRKAFGVSDDHLREMAGGRGGAGLAGTRLWVVDDIMTTGATMHFACRALSRAGLKAGAFSLTRLPAHQ